MFRLLLAGLHYNENADRQQAINNSGEPIFTIRLREQQRRTSVAYSSFAVIGVTADAALKTCSVRSVTAYDFPCNCCE